MEESTATDSNLLSQFHVSLGGVITYHEMTHRSSIITKERPIFSSGLLKTAAVA